jgi:hypothetical protein
MIRTKLGVLLFVFVVAAALLPQALFAQGYTVCADEADPQSCAARQAQVAATVQLLDSAVRRTACADDAVPASCVERGAQPSTAHSPQRSGTVLGVADVNPADTAGAAGIGQPHAARSHHSHSGGHGPHHAEE